MKYIGVFIIWVAACALQDYVLKIEISAWIMLYGFVAGVLANVSTGVWPIKKPSKSQDSEGRA